MLKGLEAAGFTWVQVHAPPRQMLCDRERLLRHAGALRATMETSSLNLVLHAPDDLSAGEPAHDRALDGLLDYAAATGARQVVYHGANLPVADGGEAAARVRRRAAAEEASVGSRRAVWNGWGSRWRSRTWRRSIPARPGSATTPAMSTPSSSASIRRGSR